MATLLKVTTSSTIKQPTPRFHVCNCLGDARLGDAHCGPAKTLYVCSSRLAFGRRELVLLSMHPSSHKLPDRIIEHAQIWAPLWYDESLDLAAFFAVSPKPGLNPAGSLSSSIRCFFSRGHAFWSTAFTGPVYMAAATRPFHFLP